MLKRILIVAADARYSDPRYTAKINRLRVVLAGIAERAWPGSPMSLVRLGETASAGQADLRPDDMVILEHADAPLLRDVLSRLRVAGPCPLVLLMDGPGCVDQALDTVHGTLKTDDLSSDRLFLTINNALVSRVRDRSEPARTAGNRQAPATAWQPTQVVTHVRGELSGHSSPPLRRLSRGKAAKHGVEALGHKVLSHLAGGGVADVFLAERGEDARVVVLKVVDGARCDDAASLERFVQECTLVSRIENPYVGEIHDCGFLADRAFISMEYFPGGDLHQRTRRGLDEATSLTYLIQLARGLLDLHKHDVIHRDLKPGNVLFRRDETAAITDPGIARLTGSPSAIAAGNSLAGMPFYTAPELVMGRPPGIASDLYSLGVIYFEMLTGRKPYASKDMNEVLQAIASSPFPAMDDRLRDHQYILDRLVAKDPADRYRSATELIAEASALCRKLDIAVPPAS